MSQPPSGFMLHIYFSFFNVESIRGFISNFVAVYFANLYPFGITFIIKISPLDTLTFLVTTFRNQDNTVVFIRVDEYG